MNFTMRKIDAHAHTGYFGSFFDVGITPEQLICQMDEYEIEKTVISTLDNQETAGAYSKWPDRLVPIVWVNPTEGDLAEQKARNYLQGGFYGIKLHPLLHSFVADDAAVDPIMKL